MSDALALECRQVVVRFGGLVAVRDVDLQVPAGQIVGLVGPNGAGKSTLFGVVSGLLRPSEGHVYLHGDEVSHLRPQDRAGLGLARTFQHPELFSGLTVRQHLILSYRVRHAKRRTWSDLFTLGSLKRADPEETARVDELLEQLGITALAETPALGLPLGSARLVELGRALANEPSVLLLDEPSSGLDSRETAQFEETLRRVARERGISVLLVEHDVELVMRLCASIYVLDFGALIAHGPPAQVRSDPAVKAAYLGEEVANAEPPEPPEEVVLAAAPAKTPDVDAGSLAVRDLVVSYGEAAALHGISFDLEPGQVLAVVGPNGAGKSSLARALSGLVRPSSGRITFGREDITDWPADRIRRAGVIHLPEGRGVFRSLSVLDNLRMAASAMDGRAAKRQAVDQALETFPALATRRRQLAGSLSGGEQQMLSLARALATAPRLIVADEMSLGLAPLMVDLVFDGLNRIRATGVSVIMIEQYVHRALAFADQCLVMQRGQVAWYGRAADAGAEVLTHYLGSAMTAAS
ncbi:MAG TPA: ATP-binding cassette domain-containing protein [Acidimicrobiales bacterium]|nr:ATP-binding cassette domain-containing protein [Acidimicrobiales bacterium]